MYSPAAHAKYSISLCSSATNLSNSKKRSFEDPIIKKKKALDLFEQSHMLKFILLVASAAIFVLLLISIFFFFFRHKLSLTEHRHDVERPCNDEHNKKEHTPPPSPPSLATFEGGEDLTIDEILEAPGEVIGKSHYGTLYKASLQSTQSTRLLRFLRPGAGGGEYDVVRFLGSIRHRNLVPMLGFYAGGRGERLLVHPFYGQGNLAELIRGKFENFGVRFSVCFSRKWKGKWSSIWGGMSATRFVVGFWWLSAFLSVGKSEMVTILVRPAVPFYLSLLLQDFKCR
ncbi:putative kinase-like protein TMKL1 [Cucurbita pepo subsp. pepo]|uniref:putative kinase-like protein TMKL1 n=1 Tax=Cucurbita pepo subsp. pepo TaxID=3664 RepID=UPI000C9D45D0|nr:putative kinase-like protein TMKL1 [Cucurbita pepo subsp. pepo]